MADIDVRSDRVVEHTGFRLSWGGIFAGLVTAMVLQMALSLLGLAIGFTAWDPGDPMRALGIGALIWVAVSMLVAFFVGGQVTGRLSGILTPGDGALHGFVMWGLAALFTVWMVTAGVGRIVGGVFDLVGQTTTAAAQAPGPGAGPTAITAAVRGDRDALVDAVAQQTGLSRAEAERAIADAEQRYDRTEVDTAEVRRVAGQASGEIARAAWWTLLAMALGAGAAAGGAAMTARS
jgi:hypothetical protein